MPSSVTAGAFVAFGKVRTGSYGYAGFPQSIPDQGTLTSKIVVPKNAGVLRDLDVRVSVYHTFDGDLDVTLRHLPGRPITLWHDVGATNEGFIVYLNDEAGTDIGTASNPDLDGAITGQFNPQDSTLLSIFDGTDASGTWVLSVTDDSASDFGTLFDWGLDFDF
jgi:subtilisin-like proprotein convertase family protein